MEWYKKSEKCKYYAAPYFSIIQSSSTGKTKLTFDYKMLCKSNYSCNKQYGNRAVALIKFCFQVSDDSVYDYQLSTSTQHN